MCYEVHTVALRIRMVVHPRVLRLITGPPPLGRGAEDIAGEDSERLVEGGLGCLFGET